MPLKSKLNILWLTPYPISKSQHPAPWIKSLAEAIVENNHSLTIITVSSKLKVVQQTIEGNGYTLLVIPYSGGLKHLLSFFYTNVYALKKYLQNNIKHYDVIHVHGTELQYASALINSKIQIPFITSIQGIITLYRRVLKLVPTLKPIYWTIASFYEKFEIRNSTNFFCRTAWDSAFVKKLNPEANLFTCWEILRKEFYEYKHEFLGNDILFMGGSNNLKGLDIALIAFDNFLKISKCNASIHIVGFVKSNFIINIINNKKLQFLNNNNIVLHGKLSAAEICALYPKCFCLYHPSLIDNSPNSVCEAQLAGLPVIATMVGGVDSLITDGENGLLVVKNATSAHANKIFELYSNKNLQINLSIAAKELATERHSKANIVANTISAYHQIIKIDC